jgi:hypothetical protein
MTFLRNLERHTVRTEVEIEAAIRSLLAVADASADQYVSKAELIDLVIAFANQGTLSGVLLRVPGLHVPRALLEGGMTTMVVTGATDGAGKRADGVFGRLQVQLQKDLLAIARHKMTAARFAEIGREAARMVLVPRYPSDRRDSVRYHHLPESLTAVIAYVLVLLEGEREFGGVAQCRLDGCTSFYLRRGRPKRSPYCSDEHATKARKAAGAKRQKRYLLNEARSAKHK